jgi:hypothetical protein
MATSKNIVPDGALQRIYEQHGIAHVDRKLKAIMDKARATLEGNIRLFLEDHCGVLGARNLETPMSDIKLRLKILNIEIVNVTVGNPAHISGTWIIQSGKPLVSFPFPRMKDGKLLPQLMVKLEDKAIKVVSGEA